MYIHKIQCSNIQYLNSDLRKDAKNSSVIFQLKNFVTIEKLEKISYDLKQKIDVDKNNLL